MFAYLILVSPQDTTHIITSDPSHLQTNSTLIYSSKAGSECNIIPLTSDFSILTSYFPTKHNINTVWK